MREAHGDFQKKLTEDFRWFHRRPELSWEEFGTTERIRARLSEIEGVELLDLGLPTGVLARIIGGPAGSEGPAAALRADIDALPVTEDSGLPYASQTPGRMHACGHDFHITALLGAAELLGLRRETLPGTVVLLFQPSEENAQGAARVVETGVLRHLGVRRILALHVRSRAEPGRVFVSPGPFSAYVDRFLYRITGRGGHASAPQSTLDPIPAAARLVGALQEIVSRRTGPLDAAVVSVTRITAGTTWNVIPGEAELEGTVRSLTPAVRQGIREAMERLARSLEAEGYQADFRWLPGCPATDNDPAVVEMIRRAAEQNGLQIVPQGPDLGGEDFSRYQEEIPGALFHIGTGGRYPIHSARFTADPEVLEPAARVLADAAVLALG